MLDVAGFGAGAAARLAAGVNENIELDCSSNWIGLFSFAVTGNISIDAEMAEAIATEIHCRAHNMAGSFDAVCGDVRWMTP
ncbi:MAG: hypothetical protein ACRCWO_12035 [Bosea sp. (in: a-proteobacteria)]